MCRVFGFRSAIPSAVHHSLVRARNALTVQSRQHPDGWGIACFDDGAPAVTHGTGAAFVDGDFSRAASMVTSRTVLAHVRKASVGPVNPVNCHPFVRGQWVFAHNGDVRRWAECRADLESRIAEHWRVTLEGETDSERCFLLFLTELESRTANGLDDPALSFDAVADALLATVRSVRSLADPGADKPSVLTFVVSNGPLLAAVHVGNTLWYSTHKVRCDERHGCPMYDVSCESAARADQVVRHLLIASEPLSTENVWHPVPEDGVVGVEGAMVLRLRDPAGAARRVAPARGLGI